MAKISGYNILYALFIHHRTSGEILLVLTRNVPSNLPMSFAKQLQILKDFTIS